MPSHSDPNTLWEFDYSIIPGSGLVLRNVRHGGYWYARDIRLTGIWIGTEDPKDNTGLADTRLRLLNIGDPSFPNSQILPPPGQISKKIPAEFDKYNPVSRVAADFSTTLPSSFGGGGDLIIEQDFQFAKYGRSPPHEPGAILSAARLFPLTHFGFKRNVSSSAKGVCYLRFDYRFNINFGDVSQAGVFRDNESINLFHSGVSPNGYPVIYPAQLEDIFASAEKPMKYEIISRGLTHSKPEIDGKKATFDNVHIWPYPYPSGDLPSTPGAFYCSHLHWRWGAETGAQPSPVLSMLAPAAGQPQFRGLGWTNSQGGPLLDPRIPDQTIKFAITKNFGTVGTLSTQPFEKLFKDIRQKPESIEKGEDLVLWLSIEVFRPTSESARDWEGTVFPHGMYFAHDPEPASFQSVVAGLRRELQKSDPSNTQVWQRYAKSK